MAAPQQTIKGKTNHAFSQLIMALVLRTTVFACN